MRPGPQLQHGLGQDVGRRVTQHGSALLGVGCDNAHLGLVRQRPPEIAELSVDSDRHCLCQQAVADRRRERRACGACRQRALASVGKGHHDLVRHKSNLVPARVS